MRTCQTAERSCSPAHEPVGVLNTQAGSIHNTARQTTNNTRPRTTLQSAHEWKAPGVALLQPMSTSVSWCGFQIVGSRRSHAASGHEVKRQFFFLARMNAAACALLCAGVHVNAPLSAWRCLRVTGTAALSLHAQVQTERGREILPQTEHRAMVHPCNWEN